MKVNIGSTAYELKLMPSKKISEFYNGDNKESIECAGMCDVMAEKIYVANDFPVESRKKILYHELVHGMLTEMGSDKNDDESFVDALARQLYSLFNKNNVQKIQDFISK